MNMKKVYKAVAKKYGVSVSEVEREINAAIDKTYQNPNSTALEVSRNRILVDHSSELVCFWDGGRGGTQYTMKYAERNELTVYNLFTF